MEIKPAEPLTVTDVIRYVLVIGAAAAIGLTAAEDWLVRGPVAGAAVAALTMPGLGIGQPFPPNASRTLRVGRALLHLAASAVLVLMLRANG